VSLVVDTHRLYLADAARIDAFRRAIRHIVRPGAVVLDLGCGTGILGLMACDAGASRVYAVEDGGVIELARAAAAAGGFADRITFLNGHSRDVSLPEPVDVIASDLIGRFGVEGGVLEDGADARSRFLKPGGLMLPSRIDLYLAPVQYPAGNAAVEFWNARPAGFDFSPLRQWAVNTGYPASLSQMALLGAPKVGASLDLTIAGPGPVTIEAALEISRAGTLHGIGGWFAAQLSPRVTMTNSPIDGDRIGRRQVFFPIDAPVSVAAGDTVRARLIAIPSEDVVSWTVEVGDATFRHSTFNGMLLAREDLHAMHPDFAPRLTPRGRARKSVLELCDGSRPLRDIEAEMLRRHADLFASAADAAAFVAEVVTRYSQN
jgi:protein arginine N-methyltransferase 1